MYIKYMKYLLFSLSMIILLLIIFFIWYKYKYHEQYKYIRKDDQKYNQNFTTDSQTVVPGYYHIMNVTKNAYVIYDVGNNRWTISNDPNVWSGNIFVITPTYDISDLLGNYFAGDCMNGLPIGSHTTINNKHLIYINGGTDIIKNNIAISYYGAGIAMHSDNLFYCVPYTSTPDQFVFISTANCAENKADVGLVPSTTCDTTYTSNCQGKYCTFTATDSTILCYNPIYQSSALYQTPVNQCPSGTFFVDKQNFISINNNIFIPEGNTISFMPNDSSYQGVRLSFSDNGTLIFKSPKQNAKNLNCILYVRADDYDFINSILLSSSMIYLITHLHIIVSWSNMGQTKPVNIINTLLIPLVEQVTIFESKCINTLETWKIKNPNLKLIISIEPNDGYYGFRTIPENYLSNQPNSPTNPINFAPDLTCEKSVSFAICDMIAKYFFSGNSYSNNIKFTYDGLDIIDRNYYCASNISDCSGCCPPTGSLSDFNILQFMYNMQAQGNLVNPNFTISKVLENDLSLNSIICDNNSKTLNIDMKLLDYAIDFKNNKQDYQIITNDIYIVGLDFTQSLSPDDYSQMMKSVISNNYGGIALYGLWSLAPSIIDTVLQTWNNILCPSSTIPYYNRITCSECVNNSQCGIIGQPYCISQKCVMCEKDNDPNCPFDSKYCVDGSCSKCPEDFFGPNCQCRSDISNCDYNGQPFYDISHNTCACNCNDGYFGSFCQCNCNNPARADCIIPNKPFRLKDLSGRGPTPYISAKIYQNLDCNDPLMLTVDIDTVMYFRHVNVDINNRTSTLQLYWQGNWIDLGVRNCNRDDAPAWIKSFDYISQGSGLNISWVPSGNGYYAYMINHGGDAITRNGEQCWGSWDDRCDCVFNGCYATIYGTGWNDQGSQFPFCFEYTNEQI